MTKLGSWLQIPDAGEGASGSLRGQSRAEPRKASGPGELGRGRARIPARSGDSNGDSSGDSVGPAGAALGHLPALHARVPPTGWEAIDLAALIDATARGQCGTSGSQGRTRGAAGRARLGTGGASPQSRQGAPLPRGRSAPAGARASLGRPGIPGTPGVPWVPGHRHPHRAPPHTARHGLGARAGIASLPVPSLAS